MYAVIETGGKQYRVTEGDVIRVEKLDVDPGKTVTIKEVLVLEKDDKTLVGAPYVAGASVKAEVVDNGKAKKVVIYKYKAKKDSKKKQGHRQPYTELQIKSVSVRASRKKAEDAEAEKAE
ncbi:MAG: 50S ribosomal protein L21 [Firmicutes bacterium]|nr:50S ribosomal protein L21 [Bacillota bacterium]